MSEFHRGNRYIVIKLANLTSRQHEKLPSMLDSFASACVNSVVVETDWPEYPLVWRMIEARVTGNPMPDYDALAAQRDEGLARERQTKLVVDGLSLENQTLQQRLAEAEKLLHEIEPWLSRISEKADQDPEPLPKLRAFLASASSGMHKRGR